MNRLTTEAFGERELTRSSLRPLLWLVGQECRCGGAVCSPVKHREFVTRRSPALSSHISYSFSPTALVGVILSTGTTSN